ncbi:MAG: response regulator, partial [Prevotella sp.]|nr:response regulator [Prevotella sp.]
YNLLSNAIKYTPDNGSICVRIKQSAPETKNGTISISIENSGPGISAEQEKNLFRPFMHGYVSQGGMGIGLYNARNMAICHHGNLEYHNEDGAVFTITLPDNDSVYTPDEYKTEISGEIVMKQADNEADEYIQDMLPEALNHQTVAIIEDDPDMMQQIRSEVGVYFNVTSYTTGNAACNGILEQPPALILCDVMLPDIDGYEIVRRIRKDEGTINTPVIMLTALDDDTHQLRAYRAGADDYVTKPCNFKLLIARISRLIEWADRMKTQPTAYESNEHNAERETTAAMPHLQEKIVLDKQDKVFRERVQAIIGRHISDPAFSIDMLASEMYMGRTKFYGKVKELLGVSPNKLLMNERMRIAAELIKEGRLTIGEVAYKTGFDNQSYFNKCFKKYYGVPPGQYKG